MKTLSALWSWRKNSSKEKEPIKIPREPIKQYLSKYFPIFLTKILGESNNADFPLLSFFASWLCDAAGIYRHF